MAVNQELERALDADLSTEEGEIKKYLERLFTIIFQLVVEILLKYQSVPVGDHFDKGLENDSVAKVRNQNHSGPHFGMFCDNCLAMEHNSQQQDLAAWVLLESGGPDIHPLTFL